MSSDTVDIELLDVSVARRVAAISTHLRKECVDPFDVACADWRMSQP